MKPRGPMPMKSSARVRAKNATSPFSSAFAKSCASSSRFSSMFLSLLILPIATRHPPPDASAACGSVVADGRSFVRLPLSRPSDMKFGGGCDKDDKPRSILCRAESLCAAENRVWPIVEPISARHETSSRTVCDGMDDGTCDGPSGGHRSVAGGDGPHGRGPRDLRGGPCLGLLRPRDRPRRRGGRIDFRDASLGDLRRDRDRGAGLPPLPRRGPVPRGALAQARIADGRHDSVEAPGERSASKRTDVGLCPGAHSLPMDANLHEGERLTPHAAVAEIRRIEGLHGALARRASGLTWMIWGIVAPAIFVSYALLGILVGFPSDGDGYHALRFLFP